jgi:hypothetical protein
MCRCGRGRGCGGRRGDEAGLDGVGSRAAVAGVGEADLAVGGVCGALTGVAGVRAVGHIEGHLGTLKRVARDLYCGGDGVVIADGVGGGLGAQGDAELLFLK